VILKQLHFNVFYNGILDVIQLQDHSIFYSLLLELIEHDAECGKKSISVTTLLARYFSSTILDDDEKSEEEFGDQDRDSRQSNRKDQRSTSPPNMQLQKQNQPQIVQPKVQMDTTPNPIGSTSKPNLQNIQNIQPVSVPQSSVQVEQVVVQPAQPAANKNTRKKGKELSKEITEQDIDQNFLVEFKEHIRKVHLQEIIKKKEEDDQGDILVIEL
jgi:hypothetical protein